MTKFQNGHYFGFKAGNVPHTSNKGTKSEITKNGPATHIRLFDQMFNMVSEAPSTAEREKWSCGLGAISFDRGSKLKKAFQKA